MCAGVLVGSANSYKGAFLKYDHIKSIIRKKSPTQSSFITKLGKNNSYLGGLSYKSLDLRASPLTTRFSLVPFPPGRGPPCHCRLSLQPVNLLDQSHTLKALQK